MGSKLNEACYASRQKSTANVCFVPLAEIAASMPRPLCKYGIEKDIERSDLAIADNDDIQSGVVRDVAFRA
jgi:hypothetical protein